MLFCTVGTKHTKLHKKKQNGLSLLNDTFLSNTHYSINRTVLLGIFKEFAIKVW